MTTCPNFPSLLFSSSPSPLSVLWCMGKGVAAQVGARGLGFGKGEDVYCSVGPVSWARLTTLKKEKLLDPNSKHDI
jgi:hypothetical protein